MTDHSSFEGAHALAKRIKAYWAARGHKVATFVEQVPGNPKIRNPFYAVRSNMTLGLPRDLAKERP